jgi:hypothetical protein
MPNDVHKNSKNLKLSETKIKHVGPKVREALEKGGIKTVGDLAGSTIEEIESILESEVPPPTRTPEKIAEMIEEAKKIVAAQQKNVAQAELVAAEKQPVKVPEFTVFFNYGHIEDGSKRWRAIVHPYGDDSKPEPPKWHLNPNDEGYTVRFEYQPGAENKKPWRTVVYNGESLEEIDITGWTPDEWWLWISERALLTKEALQATAQGKEEYRQAQESIGQEMDEIRIQARLDLEQTLAGERIKEQEALKKELDKKRAEQEQTLAGERIKEQEALKKELDKKRAEQEQTLAGEQQVVSEDSLVEKDLRITRFKVHRPSDKRPNTLVADVDFEVSDELLAQFLSRIQIEVRSVNLKNKDAHLVGYDSKLLIPEQNKYEIQLEFPMPELGRYKPYCIVRSLPSGEDRDYQEDDIFNIVRKKR